jgi:hypothetical protein
VQLAPALFTSGPKATLSGFRRLPVPVVL